ncbi:hypothetical protein Nepgr_021668 [Nepenthes gracilis]|uniref:Uncharacterized protein n=1 Tax=Nepenthes gracilis TaxID=150966 RepID=A0AAD3XW46_NEPGR|nr:hypothetical protein Nepgr_021668 [Nepenthes gracilis]
MFRLVPDSGLPKLDDTNALRGSEESDSVNNIDGINSMALSSSQCELNPQSSIEDCSARNRNLNEEFSRKVADDYALLPCNVIPDVVREAVMGSEAGSSVSYLTSPDDVVADLESAPAGGAASLGFECAGLMVELLFDFWLLCRMNLLLALVPSVGLPARGLSSDMEIGVSVGAWFGDFPGLKPRPLGGIMNGWNAWLSWAILSVQQVLYVPSPILFGSENWHAVSNYL